MTKVLLVDDDILVIRGLKTLIPWESMGMEIAGEARNGRDALALAHQVRPELILTDIKMPLMDGLDLCARIREELGAIPIILMSAYEDFDYARQAIRFGVREYVIKPIDRPKVEQLIVLLHSLSLGHGEGGQPSLPEPCAGRAETDPSPATSNAYWSKRNEIPLAPEIPSSRADNRGSRTDALVLQCKAYIRDHLAEPDLSVGQIAAQLYLSPSHLSVLFHQATGGNLVGYIAAQRMAQARKLLADPVMTVQEVAVAVGYKDAHYFARVFRKQHGTNPTEYRQVLFAGARGEEEP